MLTPQDILENTFIQPIVVAGPLTTNDSEPVTVRIRHITPKGFEILLQELDHQDDSHSPETFSYIAMEKDPYTLDNCTKYDACSYNGGEKRFRTIIVQRAYNRIPLILSQIITEIDTDAVNGRVRNIGLNPFDYLLQEQQTTKTSQFVETVDYTARDPDQGELSNLTYEAGTTADRVTHNWFDLSFQCEFPDAPLFIAGIQSYDDTDTSTVRNPNVCRTTAQIKVEADQSKDAGIGYTPEVVG